MKVQISYCRQALLLAQLIILLTGVYAPPPPPFGCPSAANANAAGLYPDPTDSHYFYQCDGNGRATRLMCPSGLIFSSTTHTCVPAISCSAAAASNPTGLYPDPSDCGYFYQCSNGDVPYRMPCPAGLHYNSFAGYCDYPELAGCAAFAFSSSGDNEQWIFADGVQIGHMADWTQTLTVSVPAGTRILAAHIKDVGVIGGLLGSSAAGWILTDSSWKCIRTQPAANWAVSSYDDSAWPQAAAWYQNGAAPWGVRPGIALNANWIWNLPYETVGSEVNVFCRKRLH